MSKRFLQVVVVQILIMGSQIFAQGGGASGEQPERPRYNSRNNSGVFYYDIDEVVEKIKVKEEDQDRLVAKYLKGYNKKVKKIDFLNTKNFEELDKVVNGILNSNPTRDNPLEKPKDKEHLIGVIKKVREELKKEEEVLNDEMIVALSEKQYKKWLKYQKNKKRELLPKRPQSSSAIDRKTTGSSFGSGGQLGQRRNGF